MRFLLRFGSRDVGPATIGALVVVQALLWSVARPAGEPTPRYLGQLLGAEAVLLLSIGLVLISTLPWIEEWFDGIDRAAIWHRRVAITGLILMVPHLMLSSNPNGTSVGGALGLIGVLGLVTLALWAILPRWQSVVPKPLRRLVIAARDAPVLRDVRRIFGGYDRWRALHRSTGLFVAAGFAHGVLDGTPFDAAPVLRWSYVAVGGIGVGFYVYRELLARFFMSLHDYQVAAVRGIEDGLVEVSLRPIGKGVDFVAGQFAMVYLEAKDGWHRHPFTISSAPDEGVVRFTVKALGDYTSRLRELIEPGMPAVIGGPHGRFTHWKGTDRQVWIAGGVGVAPFLSWLRALDEDLPHRVDFFYSAPGEPAFAPEIRKIADRYGSLHPHLINTSIDGRLTVARVLADAGGDARGLSVFMCGPEPMLRSFQSGLQSAGVPSRRIHREFFDWR
jgi:predicted ferric reductase